MKLTNSQQLVYDVIQNNEGVQNSDARLVSAVWRSEGWRDDRTLEYNLSRVTNSETITRARRWLHEKGYITYSRETKKKRFDQYKEQTAHYSKYEQIGWFR